MNLAQRLRIGLAVTMTGMFGGCGGGGDSPAAPATSPAPAPAPTPAATPTPMATPVPGTTCPFSPGSPQSQCAKTNPSFLTEINTAIDQLIQQRPDIFDLNEDAGNGNYRVLSVGQYYLGVIANLERMNLCANFDGEELQVRDATNASEQYHILISSGHIRRGPSIYRVSCFPAAFPLPRTTPGPAAGCPLPGSREVACGRESAMFLADVEAGLDQLAREQPELFNQRDIQPGTNFIKVLDVDGYIAGMLRVMKAKGFCAHWDGEELQMKKDQTRSVQYDILTAGNYTRRGEGAYRATCYPPAF